MAQSDKYPRLVELPKIVDPRGNLSFVQEPGACPFAIERVYWIYDIPADRIRHGRALRHTDEFIIALSGAFDVTLENADSECRTYHLDRCYRGLFVPAGTWRTIDNFTSNSVAMVLASSVYDEADYIEDRKQYDEEYGK